jgi:hypothetical protein
MYPLERVSRGRLEPIVCLVSRFLASKRLPVKTIEVRLSKQANLLFGVASLAILLSLTSMADIIRVEGISIDISVKFGITMAFSVH